MAIKNYKPITPARRYMTTSAFKEITKKSPEKRLAKTLKNKAGRNKKGRITLRHIGGGHKRKYRLVDFKRNKDGVPAKVAAIEYDPNRSANIALLHYADGEKRYILAPKGLAVGDTIESGEDVDIKTGNAMPLSSAPIGTVVHNIELTPGRGGQMARAAGTAAQLVAKEGNFATLRLPSGEMRNVRVDCKATVGQVGNVEHENRTIGKAGRSRWLNRRPHVRGVVMNPVDHPHGGGEGRSPIGRKSPVTPWGKPTLGYKTRRKTKETNRYIVKHRKSSRREV